MTRLPTDMTRCVGIGCRVRERCLRHRAIGDDEMAPHGTLSERIPYADNLGGGAACAFRIVPADGNGPGRPLDGPQGDFSGAGGRPSAPPGAESALEGGA